MTRRRTFLRRCVLCWVLAVAWLALPAAQPWAADPAPAPTDAAAAQPGGPAPGKVEPLPEHSLVPTTNPLEIMRRGGILMWPLLFCSLIGVTFVFERLVALRRSRVIPRAFVTRFLQQIRDGSLDRDAALALCEESGTPIAKIFSAGVRKWGRPGIEVEQAIMDAGDRATHGLRKYLRVFSALTVIGPLLGLLGTAFGMIKSFNAVAIGQAIGRPERLADGISQALLNTAFGLAVAIPAQTFYYYFVSRVDQLIVRMDEYGQELVNLISAEDLANRSSDSRAAAKARRAPRRESEPSS